MSVFFGDGEQSLKRRGGMARMVDFNFFLGGVLGALGAHFASFFRLRFLHRFFIDFFSSLEGFGRGFGMPKGSKNRYLGCFGGYAFRDSIFDHFSIDFCKNRW